MIMKLVFMVLALVNTIVNYDCKTFIVQAAGCRQCTKHFKTKIIPLCNKLVSLTSVKKSLWSHQGAIFSKLT
jgi:hypothetical protein